MYVCGCDIDLRLNYDNDRFKSYRKYVYEYDVLDIRVVRLID